MDFTEGGFDLGVQVEPFLFLGELVLIAADESDAADVVGAAGHSEAAEDVGLFGQVFEAEAHALDADFSFVVTGRMLHAVDIPDAELIVLDFDHVRLHVVGQILFADAVVAGAVGVFKDDVAGIVHALDDAAVGALFGVFITAVEDNEVGKLRAFGHELTHIGQIIVEGGRVDQRNHLRKFPLDGLFDSEKILDAPDAVVFDDDALGAPPAGGSFSVFFVVVVVVFISSPFGGMRLHAINEDVISPAASNNAVNSFFILSFFSFSFFIIYVKFGCDFMLVF